MASIDVFLDSRTARELASNISNAQSTWKSSIMSAILSAISSGLKSASVSTLGQTAADIHYVLHILNSSNLGYQASLSGSTLSIAWT